MPAGNNETTMQFIERMQQTPDLTERELQLLDRLMMAMDEVQALEAEARRRDRELDEPLAEAA